ncbi:MAG: HEAT repeat domain-containing protein [Verrucomicrobiales bacterium]|nr:HEAT repeat domain-containing protein [Verrucomicrobiales bacterium]
MATAKRVAALGPTSAPAVPARIQALGDEEWQVRKPAAEALAAIDPSARAAAPALRDCLNDPEIQVRRAAALAIKKIDERASNRARPAPAKLIWAYQGLFGDCLAPLTNGIPQSCRGLQRLADHCM